MGYAGENACPSFGPCLRSRQLVDRRLAVYHHMYGNWGSAWDWLWMTFMVVLWLVVIGAIVYAAVRLAVQHEHQQKPPLQQ